MSKTATRFGAVLILMVLLSWSVSPADTHYVSKTGSNSFPYTSWATAADTVARAVEAASEWDTILVAAGNYVTDTIRMKRGQALIGSGAAVTILDSLPMAPVITIVANDSCIIEHFTLQGGNGFTARTFDQGASIASDKTINDGVRIGTDQAVTIRNTIFIEMAGGVSALFSDELQLGRVCKIESSRFENCGNAVSGFLSTFQINDCYFGWDRRGRGIDLEHCKLSVTNSKFNAYDPFTQDFGGIAIAALECDSIVIRNNLMISTLHVRALSLDAIGMSDTIAVGVVENNTIVGFQIHVGSNRPGIQYRNNISTLNFSVLFISLQPISTYNLTWDNTPWDSGIVRTGDTIANDIPGNQGNFNMNPMFRDTLEYMLQAFSPAIDAGDPNILDADGSRSDIGYTGGPGGISYVYQDLPPKVPVGVRGIPNVPIFRQEWTPNRESDLSAYEIDYIADSRIGGPLIDTIITVEPLDSFYVFDDSVFVGWGNVTTRMRAVDSQDNRSDWSPLEYFTSGGVSDDLLPREFELHPNYPNPFNASTQITYTLPQPFSVTLTIYDALGRHVTTLVKATQAAGEHIIRWDGTDERGKAVGSGVYFYRLTVGDEVTARKMLMLK